MNDVDWAMIIIMITAIWIGWPLYRIADSLRELRDLAKGGRK